MKILIAADMEGIAGVVSWEQVTPGSADYERFRRLMTDEVNAAVRGAFDGGASQVSVTDGHNNGRNIRIEDLDPRARLNSGSLSPLSMVQGVEDGVQGVLFIGYHARIGTPNAILEHTWSDERLFGVWVNGTPFGESALNAAVCGHFGAPVLMVSGDQAVCAEARQMLGEVETAAVKTASGRMAAECLHPSAAQELIYQAAVQAVTHLKNGQAPALFKVPAPITLLVDFVQSEMADKAAILPGARRLQGRQVEYTGSDMLVIYRAFRALLGLARA